MHILDLTQKLYNNIPVMSGDNPFRLVQDRFLTTHGYNGYRLETGLHVGTHIDCASHLTTNPILISDIPLDRFMGKGVLIDARGKKIITADDYADTVIEQGSIVLVLTGTDKLFGQETYFTDIPLIDESFAELMVARRIKMLGIDYFSPDKYPFVIHKMLFNADVLIMENLTNLESLTDVDSFTVIAMPLNIPAEASLVRCVAAVD